VEEVQHQNFNIDLFAKYVAEPSEASFAEPAKLIDALEKYPYCQLLHLFYAKANAGLESNKNDNYLARTSLIIPDRSILYTILNNPQNLKTEKSQGASETGIIDEYIKEEIVSSKFDNEPSTFEQEEIISTSHEGNKYHKNTEVVEEKISDSSVQAGKNSVEPAFQSQSIKTEYKVSKYDDDKMPYSFLWWLNKTRKEYTDTYQPYVAFKLDTTQNIKRGSVDQLSSQIIENIFHLQSPLEETESTPKTIPFQIKSKEDSILEKFIKEEPQLKAPNSQKLDTENKARKSSEDPNDLVSETLAQIYIDQMLFQKALETFKKLSLKYPEKSTYFADQISQLEKKIN
jgi:hypothetical protein